MLESNIINGVVLKNIFTLLKISKFETPLPYTYISTHKNKILTT